MAVRRFDFGTADGGTPVHLYVLTAAGGTAAKVATYGARLTELHVPDACGETGNVLLGFDRIERYRQPRVYFGAVLGRVAHRIGGAKFVVNGRLYRLTANDGEHAVHGGTRGFDKVVWAARPFEAGGACGVTLAYRSPHMEEGFPGDLSAEVTVTLADGPELRIDYAASAEQPTPVNLAHHLYFNLAGAGRGDVLDHRLTLMTTMYAPGDDARLPTGEIKDARGSDLDFTGGDTLRRRIGRVRGGYDHHYVLDGVADPGIKPLRLAAALHDPLSGRTLEVLTTRPVLHVCTGDWLDGTIEGNGGVYAKHAGLLLSPQHFPDAVHHSRFPTVVLPPGEPYRHTDLYRFGTAPAGAETRTNRAAPKGANPCPTR